MLLTEIQEMGLGKTLSVLALICWSLDTPDSQKSPTNNGVPRATLIVAPKSSTYFKSWPSLNNSVLDGLTSIQLYQGGNNKSKGMKSRTSEFPNRLPNPIFFRHIHPGQVRAAVYHGSSRRRVSSELENNDIVLTTYETLRSEWTAKGGALFSEKWSRLVLDEGQERNTLYLGQSSC